MIKIFPFIFIILWSSAFITTKPLIDNSDPFSALTFRFGIVAIGFFIFSIITKNKILIKRKFFLESFFSGVLFHGLYLGGVFFVYLFMSPWSFWIIRRRIFCARFLSSLLCLFPGMSFPLIIPKFKI